jgi:hypothetical protein
MNTFRDILNVMYITIYGDSLKKIPFFIFIILISLIFASSLTTGEVSKKLKLSCLLITASLGGILLLSMLYYSVHISFSIMNVVIGFIGILGIMIIVLLSSKKEHYSGYPNVQEGAYTMSNYPNHSFSKNNNQGPLTDGTVCIATPPEGHYFTTVKDGVCGTFQAKYANAIDNGEGGIYGEGGEGDIYGEGGEGGIYGEGGDGAIYGEGGDGGGGGNNGGLGIGTNSFETQADIDARAKDIQNKIDENIASGKCISDSEDCIEIDGLEEGGNLDDYVSKHCKKMCGDFCGLETLPINKCCTKADPTGIKTVELQCKHSSFNGKKYSDIEVVSMTTCLPLTSDFNYSCQYANPPCSQYKNISDCKALPMCSWNSNTCDCYIEKGSSYKYSNYIPQDFGYKQILKGHEGGCPNTYGRAICSPNYYSGIQKVPNSTGCLDMDSTNFVDSCIDDYGYNQDKLGETNSFGCSPKQTRKICNKNKETPIKYMGCYSTKGGDSVGNISSAMECISACNKVVGNKYAAITKGNQCACSQSYSGFIISPLDDSSCNIPCNSGFTRNCGGVNASSIYKL